MTKTKKSLFPAGTPAEYLCVCCGAKAGNDGIDLCDPCYYGHGCTEEQRRCA